MRNLAMCTVSYEVAQNSRMRPTRFVDVFTTLRESGSSALGHTCSLYLAHEDQVFWRFC